MNTEDLREQLASEALDAPLAVADVMARARTIRRTRWALGSTAMVVLALVASLVVRNPLAASTSQYPVAALPSATASSSAPVLASAPMNVLLIGSDASGTASGTSDSLMVVHVAADRKSVYLVSYPRDMWVTIPGHGKGKLSLAYTLGGPALTVSALENLTGARIDHVIKADITGFVSLVDALGPVTVDNPVGSVAIDDRGVRYDFPAGQVRITDGRMALAFTRQRVELPNGDFDRASRQRAFMQGLALKVAMSDVMTNPTKLDAVIVSMSKTLVVDSGMTNDVVYSLARSLASIRDTSQILLLQAPVTGLGRSDDGQTIDLVDVAGNVELGKALQADTMAAYVAAHPS